MLETVIYAGHAWSQMLPGRFKPDKEGVGLTLNEDGRSYRKGFFLGDGTGAGKGRQVAACILDSWLQGRRRHIWVTKNEPLLEDARRDWSALGGMAGDVQPVSNWKIDEAIRLEEGVLFVTYPTLRSMRTESSRLQQILDWAGPDFDGVETLDKSHLRVVLAPELLLDRRQVTATFIPQLYNQFNSKHDHCYEQHVIHPECCDCWHEHHHVNN